MAIFDFDGDIIDISERQLEYIGTVLEERGFKNGKVSIEPVGQAGDNFVANVKRIVINKDGETFKMVAKIAPNDEIHREMMNSRTMFYAENFMYTMVLSKFAELEREANVPERERLKFAECYGCFMEEPNEIILLEDLCVSNFVMLQKFNSLSTESIKLVLGSFASFHSLSYALKQQDYETFKQFAKNLKGLWELMGDVEETKQYFEQLQSDIIAILDKEEHKNLVKSSLTDIVAAGLNIVKSYRENTYSVIQQGDPWTNNIMFKFDGDNVVECCMIDYQISNENSPASDLHYMIFNCTDYDTRSKHYHEWIDFYYTELEKRLSNFGLNAKEVYPRAQLNMDLQLQGKISFGQSVMLASLLMREHHEAAKVKETFKMKNGMEEMLAASKLSTMTSDSMVRFKDRLEGLIKSYIELEYL